MTCQGRESGIGNRESGIGNRERGTVIRFDYFSTKIDCYYFCKGTGNGEQATVIRFDAFSLL
ncbi:MAG: hypothetical protein F6K50_48945 [Moorea sp. SIO3I7]|uniref:hypothetical protein n=1 Tax=Moorena sp. SIO3F7 TaxID=2607839 RepID=UPI000A895F6A|nr:hypothetical protein [Moorena sp. SIO3F7]NEO02976.1 hypothetical protein [Moorena sp. SIO3I7]NEO13970.1 hypothetical protein [Moorena sp. SIO3E8]NEO48539.1 hypothetical protein [Moorena sp. SIO4A3]NEQ00032.1 hypothetical protein [Moorena sp. SIO3F7]